MLERLLAVLAGHGRDLLDDLIERKRIGGAKGEHIGPRTANRGRKLIGEQLGVSIDAVQRPRQGKRGDIAKGQHPDRYRRQQHQRDHRNRQSGRQPHRLSLGEHAFNDGSMSAPMCRLVNLESAGQTNLHAIFVDWRVNG